MSGYSLLWRELRRQRRAWAPILAWSVVESLPSLLSGLTVSAAFSRFAGGDVPAGLGLLMLLLASAAVGAAATRQLFPWLAAVVEPVRNAFVVSVVESTVADAIDGRPDAAGVARLTEQVQSVREMLFTALRVVRQIAFMSVSALVGLSLLTPLVALTSTLLLLAALVLFAALLPPLAARQRAVLLAEEEVARRSGVALGGIRDAIACGAQERVVGEVGLAVRDSARSTRALARLAALRSLVVFVGGHLPLVGLLVSALWLEGSGRLTLSELVGAITYVTTGLEPALRKVVDIAATWGLEMAVSVRRLGEGLPAAVAGASTATEEPGPSDELTVRDLTFAYGPRAAAVVDGLDLTIPPGGHLAVVGPSGIGKSTLANLLAGLLPAQHGTIRLGGVELSRLDPVERRRAFGLIPQEAYVFSGTLRENLTYLAPTAADGRVLDAARTVGLSPVVDQLGGLDALVGVGGADLSAGERQLVALTRVYLSPARVVILDEATSNLDPVAEAQAENAFAERDGSLVVVAHRISSARRARQVLLFDSDGARLGTHDELVESSALYADLVGRWTAVSSDGVHCG
jgi:ATP-binding cassette subfamily C protein